MWGIQHGSEIGIKLLPKTLPTWFPSVKLFENSVLDSMFFIIYHVYKCLYMCSEDCHWFLHDLITTFCCKIFIFLNDVWRRPWKVSGKGYGRKWSCRSLTKVRISNSSSQDTHTKVGSGTSEITCFVKQCMNRFWLNSILAIFLETSQLSCSMFSITHNNCFIVTWYLDWISAPRHQLCSLMFSVGLPSPFKRMPG